MIKVAPSILSADFSCLGAEVEEIRRAGADYAHIDVMDGMFVSNISVGIPVVKSLRKATDMFLDVHLMIEKPLRYVRNFCEAGADLVNFHVESDSERNIHEAISVARMCGKKTGVTIKPHTPADAVMPFVKEIDLVLVMTVEPGFSGQSFMYDQLPKIREVREIIDALNPECELEVDGGIDADTAVLVIERGADVLVAGNAVFGRQNRTAAIADLRG